MLAKLSNLISNFAIKDPAKKITGKGEPLQALTTITYPSARYDNMKYQNTIEYTQIPEKDVPLSLLLVADPSKKHIRSYLPGSWCFAAIDTNHIKGICVANRVDTFIAEIFNISTSPEKQKQGIGTKLLEFSLSELTSKGIHRVELGTGTFGYQLTFYQRHGFRVEAVIRDYFLNNYDQPIFENDLQHKDMLRLYIELNS
ncbi:GNAT family N-acetyltransferase [Microbulbifer sp. SSSA007]|uniref:GNAT family N-acetyltransferase n=1 Tax=Microbulbifer sp. SSSA007 TaxID=3243379 RepID=UPI004039D31E